MIEVALIFLLALGLAWPLGCYMAGVFSGNPHANDRVFGPVEGIIYKLIGVNTAQGMTWKSYVWAFLLSNLLSCQQAMTMQRGLNRQRTLFRWILPLSTGLDATVRFQVGTATRSMPPSGPSFLFRKTNNALPVY